MTCDDFRQCYLEGDVAPTAAAHLRGCAECQRVTPELELLRARLGDPAVWESPGAELRNRVIGSIVSDARPARPAGRHPRWWLVAGAAAVVLLVGAAAALVVVRGRADGADWELALYATEASPAAAVTVQGWNDDTGTRLRLDVEGLAPAAPDEYYAVWMSSAAGAHVPAGTFREAGRIDAWSGVSRAGFPRIWVTLEPDDGDERLNGTTVADTPGW